MASKALMMSVKKRKEIKKRQELEAKKESKKREDLLSPLFKSVKKTSVKLAKVENYRAPDTKHIKSLNAEGDFKHSTARKENEKYTGENLIGVSILHKSCLQPIASKDFAKEVANMRR